MRQPVAYLPKPNTTPMEQAELAWNGPPSWQIQEAHVRELAARHGDEDLLLLSERERSGRDDGSEHRAGHLRLKQMVENGEVSAIYGCSLLPFAREPSENRALAELCRERGVPIRLCDERELEDGSTTGRLITSMLAAIAHMEEELARIADDTEPQAAQGNGSTRVADELAEMVCRMGGLDRSMVDRTANFADLGLDSLFLTRLAARIRKQLGVRVKLAEILDGTPTIESLAQRIEPEITTGPVAAPSTARMDPRPPTEPSDGHPRDAIMPLPPAGLNGHAAASSDDIVALIAAQLSIMNQQLDLLASHAKAAAEEPANER